MGIILKTPEIPVTLLTIDRLGVIIFFLEHTKNLEGNIAEVGTYKGGVAHYLNVFSNNKKVYLFDTFEGIPMKGNFDKHEIGDFSDSEYDVIKKYFSKDENVKIIKGVFPNSIGDNIKKEDEKFSFVHLDADQYESTLNGLNYFYNKMVSGGVMVFDDWNWLPGVNQALNEFFKDKPEEPVQSTLMQAFIVKD